MVVFGQKWFYSDYSCCMRAKRLYSGNVVLFGQSGCIREKTLYLGKSSFIRAKNVVFG